MKCQVIWKDFIYNNMTTKEDRYLTDQCVMYRDVV